MKNKLSWLGFLGFIGVYGIFVMTPTLIVFLAFFFFFSYKNMIPDELFRQNVRKAGLRAFYVYLALAGGCLLLLHIRAMQYSFEYFNIYGKDAAFMAEKNTEQGLLALGMFVWSFIVTICTFCFTLMRDSHKEKKLLEEPEDVQDKNEGIPGEV